MQAIRISQHGGPEALERLELPDPVPTAGQIPVRMTHVGLNHLDIWVRRGVESHRFPLPMVPCSDGVGVREDTGEAVAIVPFSSCDACRFCLSGRHDLCRSYHIRGEGADGLCCERVLLDERDLLPIGRLKPSQAAALPLSLLTAWHMLVGRAGLRPGDRVFVVAGAGGVGSLAIQVARHCGARVVASASTPAKRELCLQLGAEQAFSHDEAVSGVRAWTERQGVDIVVEHVGAATWASSLRTVRWGGTVVTCGATAGHQVELDLRVLFFKQLSLLGSTMGSREEMRRAWQAVQAGAIAPVVDRVLPLSQLGEAHRLLEQREARGKVVVKLDW